MAETNTTEASPAKTSNPVRSLTLFVLLIAILLFIWYIMADRYAPWTDQARIQGFIVPISPKVSGKVLNVAVVLDQTVKKGDLLVQINPKDYELAVAKAQADLELATQDIGADSAGVETAEAKLEEAKTQYAEAQIQAERVLTAEQKGAMSEAQADRARASVDTAKARVDSALAELEAAKERLGTEGKDNPRIRAATAALEQAKIDLAETKIVAPADGGITNLQIDEGHYAVKETPVMTFVPFDTIWIQANMRENSLANIKVGNPVEIVLDAAPGRIFKGEVSSIGWAVEDSSSGNIGGLIKVQGDSGWLRDAQRFPVTIKFADDSARGIRRAGAQVDVQIYTGDHAILNRLGWLWIRLMGYLSYVY